MKRFFASLLVVGLIACGANAAIQPLNYTFNGSEAYDSVVGGMAGFDNIANVPAINIAQNNTTDFAFDANGVIQLNGNHIYNAAGEVTNAGASAPIGSEIPFQNMMGVGSWGEVLIGNPGIGLPMRPLIFNPPGYGGATSIPGQVVNVNALWGVSDLSAGTTVYLAFNEIIGGTVDNLSLGGTNLTLSASAVPEPSAFAFGFLALGLVVGGKKLSRRFFNK